MSDALFLGALSTLAGVIALLYKVNQGSNLKIEKRADTIEEKHDASMGKIIEVTREVGELRGKIHLAEKIHPKLDSIHQMAQDVLEAVKGKRDDV